MFLSYMLCASSHVVIFLYSDMATTRANDVACACACALCMCIVHCALCLCVCVCVCICMCVCVHMCSMPFLDVADDIAHLK